MKIREKGRRTTSLEALVEAAGDATSALIDHRFSSLDSHVELAELSADPIAIRAVSAAKEGAAAYVAPRGMHHRNARYTDDQVGRVRELRAKGLTYGRIEQLTGVPAGYSPALVRGQPHDALSKHGTPTLWQLERGGPRLGNRAC